MALTFPTVVEPYTIPDTMRAAVLCGPRDMRVMDRPEPVTLDLSAVVRSDITIYTTRGEGGNNVKRAVSLAAQGRLRGAELVTHEFPLEEIAEAFRVMRERLGDPLKIVIIPCREAGAHHA